MKKLNLIILLTLALALPAKAQVSFGVKGGIDVSHVSFDREILNADNRLGFFVGPMLEVKVPLIGLNFDIAALYHNWEVGADGFEAETLHYVDVPVNVKYNIGLGRLAAIYLATGPQFSFALGDKEVFEATYRLKDSYFSWNVGAGLKLFNHVQIGYNFNIGLGQTADINEQYLRDTLGDDLKNNTHQVTLAILF